MNPARPPSARENTRVSSPSKLEGARGSVPEAVGVCIGEKKPRDAWEIFQIINKFPQTIYLFNFELNVE